MDGRDEHQAVIETCPDCGGPTVRWRSRHYPETFWWCPRCRSAITCACTGCLVMRVLADL
jgi:ssDNA-binding Zn-finger/Zn-ribbon topoisomerase 1